MPKGVLGVDMSYQNQVKLQNAYASKKKLQPLLGARPYETWPSGVESNVEYDEGVSEWIYFGGGGGTPGFFTPVVS